MRALDPNMQAALSAGVIVPAILAQITFASGTQYVWSGVGPLVYAGNTFQGVGVLGSVGTITEGIAVRSDGTSVTLSGIDPALYADSMDDVQLGGAATIWFALLSQGVVIGAPQVIYSGLVDKPMVTEGPDTIAITLALESRITNLQRASNRRYTSADQRLKYPDDNGFRWVEPLNDEAENWGS